MQIATFSWLDYFLFTIMLGVSAVVGVYYGFFKKQNTAQDYLLGGKQMGLWPISMSLVSSTLSGLTLLSVPAEIYKHGITLAFLVPMNIIIALTTYHLFLPVFYKLQVTSVYEFLNVRFNNTVRVFASFIYALSTMFFLPIVIYIPALALGQVTNLNVHVITPVVCGVCIFYTTLGGLRAVVWTDVIQFGVMFGSLVAVVSIGIWHGGGLATIIENSSSGGQFDISFELDFLKRDTFWAVLIGQACQMISYFSINQGPIQKFLSLPSFSLIKRALIWSTIGIAIIQSLSMFAGVIMFANYKNCDPLQTKIIKNLDQILPLYVMSNISFVPGLCGLFISGIFSAGLSTLSAVMNCLTATIYEDFISPFVPKGTSQKRISQYLKLIVIIIGITSTVLVYVVEKLGGIVAMTISISGITSGPTLGLYCVGVLFPQVNAKGALIGCITSVCVMAWIIITSQLYKMKGIIAYPGIPTTTNNCTEILGYAINTTITNTTRELIPNFEEPFVLYRVSFYWYAAMGVLIVVIVALAVSYFTKEEKPLNRDCISPVMQFLIKTDYKNPPHYDDVALEKLNKLQVEK